MKQVVLLTNFSAYLKSYSPIIVVGEQINMLKRAGYDPILITSEGWNPPEGTIFSGVRTERIYQPIIDGTTVDDKFEKEVDRVYKEINRILPDGCVVLTHDLIFLPDYVKHNVACRRIASERPDITWLHWVHSATAPGRLIEERAMFGEKYKQHLSEAFPNSIICYPNAYDIPRVAVNFGYEEDQIFEVPHPTNPVEGMSPLVQRLYNELRLNEKEVLMIYPLRLDRGKQPEINIKFIAGCRRMGLTAHVIFCDFQSTGGDKVTFRDELKALAKELGVEHDVTFLSEFDDSAQMEVSHETVLELLTLSNIFVFPSKSETYSLVTQEAMLRGNLCILNHDFAPLRQIYGKNAIYRPFSSNIGFDGYDGEIKTEYSDETQWFNERASNIRYWLENDKVLRAKTWVRCYRNPDYVFKNYIEPLINKENENDEADSSEVLGDTADAEDSTD